MNVSTKTLLTVAILSTLGLGAVTTVYASQSKPPVTVLSQHQVQEAPVAQASKGKDESNEDAEEQQEAAKLKNLAKITAQQARQSAEKAVGGQANCVELENEDGNLVYSVEIGEQEVKVDAGNGQVLYIEKDHEKDNEGNRPRSSIQVPYSEDE